MKCGKRLGILGGREGEFWRFSGEKRVSGEERGLAGVKAESNGDRWDDGVFTRMWISGPGRRWTVVELRERGGEERRVLGEVYEEESRSGEWWSRGSAGESDSGIHG